MAQQAVVLVSTCSCEGMQSSFYADSVQVVHTARPSSAWHFKPGIGMLAHESLSVTKVLSMAFNGY